MLARTFGDAVVARTDARAFDVTGAIDAGWVVTMAKVMTALGALPAVIVAVVIAVVIGRDRFEGPVLAAALGLTVVAVHAAKAAQDRPRPPAAFVDTLFSSYPSGHAAYAVLWLGVGVTLSRRIAAPRARTAVVVAGVTIAGIVGATRVILRAHYLSDVLGGWGLGAAVLALCALAGHIADLRLRHNQRA